MDPFVEWLGQGALGLLLIALVVGNIVLWAKAAKEFASYRREKRLNDLLRGG